jgi:hypothetical protein
MRDGATSPLRMKSLLSTQMTVPSSTIVPRACAARAHAAATATREEKRALTHARVRCAALPPAHARAARQRQARGVRARRAMRGGASGGARVAARSGARGARHAAAESPRAHACGAARGTRRARGAAHLLRC